MDITKTLEQDRQRCQHKLQHLRWYHGCINRNLAEIRLNKAKQEGMYLVRQSMLCPRDFVLSMITKGKLQHFMIEDISEDFCFKMSMGSPHEGLEVLIEHHSNEAHGLPSCLIVPCPTNAELPPPLSILAGYTNILHTAIKNGTRDLIKSIINHNLALDINWKNSEGETALHLACMLGAEDIARWLLFIASANINGLDREGYTPLHRACQINHHSIVKVLLEAGANPQKTHRQTCNVPLHEAVKRGHIDTVQVLLACHVLVWPRNSKGQTPYELAVLYKHEKIAKLLAAYEAPDAKTEKKYWYHGEFGREEAQLLLQAKGACDGYFLLRTSSGRGDQYALSVCYKSKVMNFRVCSQDGKAFYMKEGPLIKTIEQFIEHYTRYKDGTPHLLTHAVDTNGVVRSMATGAIIDTAHDADDTDITNNTPAPGQKIRRNPSLPPRIRVEPGKEFLEIKREDLELGAELGQGEYGSVLRGKWKVPGEKDWHNVAIKTLNAENMSNSVEGFLREAKVMLNFDHPCIVRLIGVCNGPPLMLIQELLPNGSLQDFLLDYPERIDMHRDLYRWAAQIACGMDYLESKKFVHRDLASRNILLLDKIQAKVGDFGLSRAVGEGNDYYRATKGGRWPVKWYAPECMYYGTFSHLSDVWSYGVTLWEMYTLGDQPYEDKNGAQVVEMIERGQRLACPEDCPAKVYEMMLKCWEYEPQNRKSFRELYKFFSSRTPYTNIT